MTERTTFTRLRPAERVVISSMKLMGENTRAMARVISRPAPTVSREQSRNSFPALGYTSDSARAMHALRRRAAKPPAKFDPDGVAGRVVLTLQDWKWSPQQIAATLERVFPDEPERHVSHETLYTAKRRAPSSSAPPCRWPSGWRRRGDS